MSENLRLTQKICHYGLTLDHGDRQLKITKGPEAWIYVYGFGAEKTALP